jgi:hypothetical protein
MLLIHFAGSLRRFTSHSLRIHFARVFRDGQVHFARSLRKFTSPLYLWRSVRTERRSLRRFTSHVGTTLQPEDSHTQESFRSLSCCVWRSSSGPLMDAGLAK